MNIKMSTLIKMLRTGPLDGYDQGHNSAIIWLLQDHCSFDEDNNNNEHVSEKDKIVACLQNQIPHSSAVNFQAINWDYVHNCKVKGHKLEAVKHIKDATKDYIFVGLKEAKFAMDDYFAM